MKKIIILLIVISTISLTKAQNNPFKKGDTWVGTYECNGDELSLKLKIDEVQGKIIRCRFLFLNGQGEFDMIGKYESKEFTFYATKWIKNPGNYVTLNLHGFFLKTPERLIGNSVSTLTYTEGGECTGFYLEKEK